MTPRSTPLRTSPFAVALAALCTLAALSGCDALSNDAEVGGLIGTQGVNVTVDEADLAGGILTSEGSVDPNTFLAPVRAEMGTISSVEVTRIALTSTGDADADIAAWSDLYEGELVVALVPASGTPIQVGKVTVPATGLEALRATVTATRASLDAAPDLAAGRFSVRLTAGTTRADGDTFEVPVRVELEIIAY